MHIHFSLPDTASFEVVLNLQDPTETQYSNFSCSPIPTIKPLSIEVLKKCSIGTYQKKLTPHVPYPKNRCSCVQDKKLDLTKWITKVSNACLL